MAWGDSRFCWPVWHGRTLYFSHRYQRQRFTILVSHSKDGEFVSQVLQRFGVHVTRGSSSRGGAQGPDEKSCGKSTVGIMQPLTPDGPRGPRYTVQPGIVAVAQTTGAAIRAGDLQRTLEKGLPQLGRISHAVAVQSYRGRLWSNRSTCQQRASPAVFEAKQHEVETSLRHITEMADHYFAT